MSTTLRGAGAGALRAVATGPQAVVLVGVGMVLVQLAFRAWALYGGYFLIDDFGFLANAVEQDLSWSFLFTPYGDHLQPLGFLIVWWVGQSAPYDWVLASTIILALQALASAACLAFLVRLCGRRWSVLAPLGFYLFAVTTLPGFMWWAAAVVQVPLQLAAFLAMTAHLEYVRTGRKVYIAWTSAALAVGMLCDVKIAFVGAALVFLSLYLSRGSGLRGRLVDGILRQWLAWAVYAVMFLGYLLAYLSLNPVSGRAPEAPLAILETMSRFTLGPLFLGGPWRWTEMGATPLVAPATPEWAVTMTWVLLAGLAAHAVRRRAATAWVALLLVPCLLINVLMVSTARGAVFGGVAGLEVRYLGDLAPTLVVVVAVLATSLEPAPTPTVASPGSAEPYTRRQGILAAVLAVAVVAGSFASSSAYIRNWHSDYPARVFFENVVAQAERQPLLILDQQVPQDVVPREGPTAFEVPSQVLTPLGDRVVASMRMNDPDVLDPEGIAYRATIDVRRESPPGPADGCGYRVAEEPVAIPLVQVAGADPVADVWWASVGYLASGDGVATLSFNGFSTDMEVQRGLHDFFFLGSGPGDEVILRVRSAVTLCVDHVRAGTLAPRSAQEAGS